MNLNREMRLPTVAVALLLALGLLSVLVAPGFFAVAWGGLLVLNLWMAAVRFSGEVVRLKAAHVGHGPVDKAALRKDVLLAQPVPLWVVITLVVGSLWAVIGIVEFVGFLLGLLFVVVTIGLIVGAAYLGYSAAKKRGLF